jgi:hypothetical protein
VVFGERGFAAEHAQPALQQALVPTHEGCGVVRTWAHGADSIRSIAPRA